MSTFNSKSSIIYGPYIKVCRGKNISLEKAGKLFNVGRSKMNEIENGQKLITEDDLRKFMEHNNIPFDFSEFAYKSACSLLSKGISAFMHMDEKLTDEFIRELRIRLNSKRKDLGYFKVVLGKALANYFESNFHSSIDQIDNILRNQKAYSNDELAFTYLLKGLCFKLTKRSKDALPLLKLAEMKANGDQFPELPSFIAYSISYPLGIYESFAKGILKAEEANELLLRSHCTFRIQLNSENKALLYLAMEEYELCTDIIEGVFKNIGWNHDQSVVFTTISNLMLTYTMSGQYSKALSIIDKHKEQYQRHLGNFVMAPWCLYKLERINDCLAVIQTIEDDYVLDKDDEALLNIIKFIINKKTSLVNKTFFTIWGHLKEEYSWVLMTLFLQILDDYYSQNYNAENLASIRLARLQIRQHFLPDVPKLI